jgi:hypothetical protein
VTGKDARGPEFSTPNSLKVSVSGDEARTSPGTIQPGRSVVGRFDMATVSSPGQGLAAPSAPARSSVLSAALGSLQEALRHTPDIAVWQECSRRLRAATTQERDRSRRHAAMALLLADVLSFTHPNDLRDADAARRALELGWRALSEPFVSGETERRVTTELARAGWQLSLPYRGWAANG